MTGPERPDLTAELIRRAEIDQQARGFAISGRAATDAEIRQLAEVDRDNTTWLKGVIDEHGWPGIRLVGESGADKAWLLAQHADAQPDLQRRWLELLRAAVHACDASWVNLAYLEDRVATAEGRPQRYGTQWTGLTHNDLALAPLENPDLVNQRRALVGLAPLKDTEIAAAWPTDPRRGHT